MPFKINPFTGGLSPVVEDLSESNSSEFSILYVNGDEETDGSRRIIVDPLSNVATFEERTGGVWNLGELLISGESLNVGRNLTISAAGEFLIVQNKATQTKSIVALSKFDDSGTEHHAENVIFTPRHLFTAQPIFDTEFIGTQLIAVALGVVNTVTYNILFKTGSVVPTEEMVFTIRLVDENGPVLYQRIHPASQFPANSDITIEMVPSFDFPIGTLIHAEWTSISNFSMLTNPSGFFYFTVDIQIYEFERLVTLGAGTNHMLSDKIGDRVSNKNGDIVYRGDFLPQQIVIPPQADPPPVIIP